MCSGNGNETGFAAREPCHSVTDYGTSLNPARSLGPAVVSGDYGVLWVYLLVPRSGLAAAAAWRLLPTRVLREKLFHDRAYPSVMGKRCAGDATRLRRLALAQQGPGRRWPAGPVKHSPRPLGQTTWLRCREGVVLPATLIHCQNDDGGVTIVEDGIGEYSAKGGPRLNSALGPDRGVLLSAT